MKDVLDLPRSADVVILGAGLAGMATAWALRQRGVTDLIVIDREAQVGPRAHAFGRQLAEDDELTALTVRGAAIVRELFAAWSPTGGLLTFDNVEHARAYFERAARFGVEAHAISRETVLAHWPALDAIEIASALFVPDDGVVDADALLAAFGAEIEVALRTRATAMIPLSGGARILTSRGDIVARIVVDAMGARAGELAGDLPLESFKRHSFVLDANANPDAPFVWHLGVRQLAMRGAGGKVLVSPCDAMPVPTEDHQPDPDGEAKLRRALVDSPYATSAIRLAMACTSTFSESGAILLGCDPMRGHLAWAAALGVHGVTASAAIGEVVSASVAHAL